MNTLKMNMEVNETQRNEKDSLKHENTKIIILYDICFETSHASGALVDHREKDNDAHPTDNAQPAVGDVPTKEPKKSYRTREPKAAAPKRCEPKASLAASKCRNTESAGDHGTQHAKKAKSKVAPKKKI